MCLAWLCTFSQSNSILAGAPADTWSPSPCCLSIMHIVLIGLSRSEGGFKENKVSSASVLDVQAANDKKGKPYYKYEILTRTGMQCLAFPVVQAHLGRASKQPGRGRITEAQSSVEVRGLQ